MQQNLSTTEPPALAIPTIWGIGRNYAQHARELGNMIPSEPIVFLKSAGCICRPGNPLRLPTHLGTLHHEVELAIQVGHRGEIVAAALALDLTARDLQEELKKNGLPWTRAKSFLNSCPLGELIPVRQVGEIEGLTLTLQVNGEIRQRGSLKDLIFPLPTLVNYLRQNFPLRPGDLILTGTPPGVGPIYPGDHLVALAEGWSRAEWFVHPTAPDNSLEITD